MLGGLAIAWGTLTLPGCGGRRVEEVLVSVTVESAPEQGASVLMAGEEQGVTPVTIEGVPPGDYEVVLRLERYRRKIESITVTQESEQSFVVDLEPIVGFLSVSSTPPGASVYLDGEHIGETPLLSRTLQVGPYAYDLRHPDYYPVDNRFVMEDGFKMEFNHELRPLEAELTIFSRPSSAAIWLNNILQAQQTPSKFLLRPGRYLVSVHTNGFLQVDEVVEMHANEPQTLQMVMTPGNVPQGMVLIPAGEFVMGADERAPDERPARKVTLPAFYIDRFEVTNQAFKEVFPEHRYLEGNENLPATGVSWAQAVRYCEAVGKRLPTEAEWEKAARGENGLEFPWGDVFEPSMANTQESQLGAPVRVGSYFTGRSPYGTMDMAGNAYEWVFDWYEPYPGNKYVTKDYGQIFRVLRGGSYLTGKFEARTPKRHFDRMDAARRDYGCRCAMNARE